MDLLLHQHATRIKNSIISFTFIVVFLLGVNCGGEEDEVVDAGPDLLLRSSGILCTMGINSQNKFDTLYVVGTPGTTQIRGYYRDPKPLVDNVAIIQNGNKTVSIQHTDPYVDGGGNSYKYFTILKGSYLSSFPDHDFLFTYSDSSSPDIEFVVVRDADDFTKFTIESKSQPGYYLGTKKWAKQNYPLEGDLVFTSNKQKWFFTAY